MAQRRRPRLTERQRDEIWARWHAGQTLTDIGEALGRYAGAVRGVLVAHGGVPRPARTRAARVLSSTEREVISRGLAAGRSQRSIAAELHRAPSTISREIARNAGPLQYRAESADVRAWAAARRPKPCRLATHRRLRRVVARRLRAQWSPAQVAGWLVTAYPTDPTMRVSHETIYRTLFIQARGGLKRELLQHLRTRRTMRRSQRASTVGQGRGQIVDAVSIRARPPEVADRALPGHWEGDLLAGARNSHLVTLVERQSRFVQLIRVGGKDTTTVVRALIRRVQRLPAGLMRSLTWDRGMEMAQHHRFTVATDVAVYFCDPQSPWQRGSNENTNGLLRQYFPHGADLSGYSQAYLDRIANRLNTRPRKTLGFRTPAEVLAQRVAPIG